MPRWARRSEQWLAIGLSGLIGGCLPYQWHDTDPPDDTDPRTGVFATVDTLAFETLVRDGAETQSFQIVNRSGHAVTVWNYTSVHGSARFAVEGTPQFAALDEGDVFEVPVTFRPVVEGYESAYVTVNTDDGSFDVQLDGHGRAGVLQAEMLDVPDAVLGCTGQGALRLGNPGSDALRVFGGEITDGADLFTVGVLPTEIPAGEQVDVPVTYTPTTVGGQLGFLKVTTNQPAVPSLTVSLTGVGQDVPWQVTSGHYATGGGVQVLVVGDDVVSPTVVPQFTAQVPRLVEALDARGVDWRLTAVSAADACPGFVNAYATPTDRPEDVAQWIEQTLVDGVGGTYAKKPLTLARHAIEDDAGCLRGYLRTGDPTVVVVLTEQDDTSSNPVDEVSRMEEVTGLPTLEVIACPSTLPVLGAAAGATAGHVYDRCDETWISVVSDVADAVAAREGGPRAVTLPEAADPARVRLTVDGKLWLFDLDDAHVVVTPVPAPPVGAAMEVTWVPADVCTDAP